MGKLSPWRKEMDRLLLIRPQTFEELVDAVAHLVPAGNAYRDEVRTNGVTARTDEAVVAAGRRRMIRSAVFHAVRNGSWHQDGDKYYLTTKGFVRSMKRKV